MLARAGFRDDSALAHSPGDQDLADAMLIYAPRVQQSSRFK